MWAKECLNQWTCENDSGEPENVFVLGFPNCWEPSLRSTAKTRTFDKLRGHIFEQKMDKTGHTDYCPIFSFCLLFFFSCGVVVILFIYFWIWLCQWFRTIIDAIPASPCTRQRETLWKAAAYKFYSFMTFKRAGRLFGCLFVSGLRAKRLMAFIFASFPLKVPPKPRLRDPGSARSRRRTKVLCILILLWKSHSQ